MPLTDEHHQFRELIRQFVEREINPRVEEWEDKQWIPLHEVFAEMAGLGFLGLEYDAAYGGQGADHLFTMVLAEEMGRADHGSIGMALGVQVAMATPSLHRHGSEELKQAYLAPALRGEMVAAIAVTEPDAGSDVAAIRTRAIPDGDEWVITGAKMFITNSLQADWLCLLARTSEEGGYRGMSQIVVPTSTPGFSVSRKLDKLGMKASDTGLLALEEVRVPRAHTIGEEGRGFQQQMAQFVVERMWGNYSAVAGMERALQRTREYVGARTVFGGPLGEKQHIRFRFAELAAEVDLLRHYNLATAEGYDRGEDVTRMATIGKLKAGRLAREVADTCLQFHGGMGYMEETWTSRYLRDVRLLSIGAGADEVMLDLLSRGEGAG